MLVCNWNPRWPFKLCCLHVVLAAQVIKGYKSDKMCLYVEILVKLFMDSEEFFKDSSGKVLGATIRYRIV